jgi:hypothetical protein
MQLNGRLDHPSGEQVSDIWKDGEMP